MGKLDCEKMSLHSGLKDRMAWQEYHIDLCGERFVQFTNRATRKENQQQFYLSQFLMLGNMTNFTPLTQKTAEQMAKNLDMILFCRYPCLEVVV